MNATKILKAHCTNTGQYFVIEAEKNGAVYFATKFYPITLEQAKQIKSEIFPVALQTGGNLPKCKTCGSRRVAHGHGVVKCSCSNNHDDQSIYCGNLVFDRIGETNVMTTQVLGRYDVYFVMDASGSMGMYGLKNAAKAVQSFIQNLNDQDNIYNFVPFGASYTYLVKNEKDLTHITKALDIYKKDKSNVGYSTNGQVIEYIKSDVINSKRPVRIIVVTDGYWDNEKYAFDARREILNSKKDVEIMAIGIDGANQQFLSSFGTVAEFSKLIDASKLESTLLDISRMMKVKI